jgi:hypothetical protein
MIHDGGGDRSNSRRRTRKAWIRNLFSSLIETANM